MSVKSKNTMKEILMKIVKIIIVAFCLIIINAQSNYIQARAFIDDFGGPWVVWVNLSKNTVIDKMLITHINDTDLPVYTDGMYLFKLRPTGITNELVRMAVIHNDKKAIQLLDDIMHLDFRDFYGGFDGIIVYDEENGPRLSQIVRGRRVVVKKKLPSSKDPKAVIDLFNTLIPPNANKLKQ
jgi:hypothetical protein